MPSLADVLRRHGEEYLRRYGSAVLPSHARAIRDVVRCRTPALGGHVASCTGCGKEHVLYHSCRNRACPRCGLDTTTRWLQRQRDLLLPVRYFHVVFTLPDELRLVVRSQQRALLPVLFRAAFDSLATLCRDPRWVGGRIGALAVLHTWTRTLEWHPHVHMLVPAGGLGEDGRTWLEPRKRRVQFLVPVKLLSARFRARFLELARRAVGDALPVVPTRKRWVVYCKLTVQGAERVLEYLGRYVHRTALSDKAILSYDDATVSFAYWSSSTNERKVMTLPAMEFLRRFLQHVPAKGMHRVRAFGLLHPSHRIELRRVQLLLGAVSERDVTESRPMKPKRRCPSCKNGELQLGRRLTADECVQRVGAPTAQSPGVARGPPPAAEVCRCA